MSRPLNKEVHENENQKKITNPSNFGSKIFVTF